MFKHTLLACLVLPLTASAAFAQEIPAQQKTCLDNAFALAQSAAAKSLPQDKLSALEAEISKLEDLCDAKDYDTAAKTAKAIETDIAGS